MNKLPDTHRTVLNDATHQTQSLLAFVLYRCRLGVGSEQGRRSAVRLRIKLAESGVLSFYGWMWEV